MVIWYYFITCVCSNSLEQGPSSSMTTMDNRVGEGQGGVAATYCIDCIVSHFVSHTLSRSRPSWYLPAYRIASYACRVGTWGFLLPNWTEPTYFQHVVYITRLHLILLNFLAQEVKVEAVLPPWISLVVTVVYSRCPFWDKLVRMSLQEAINPLFSKLSLSDL